MSRSSSYTYDPQTGTWTKSTSASDKQGSPNKSPSEVAQSGANSSGGSGNLTSSNPRRNSSTGSTEKEYNEIEVNTLQGTLNFIATEETIKLKPGDTVKLNGFGKYLSGNYYVKDITRNISNEGYSHTATVIRTDFGATLKIRQIDPPAPPPPPPAAPVPSPAPADTTTPTRTYTVKKGDCLWSIAKKYYGNGNQWQKIYNANTHLCGKPYKKKGVTIVIIHPGQVLTIP